MSRLSLSLLGPLLINLDDHPITGFEAVKSRALLAYLADEPGQAQSRSSLANLLWPERPEAAALANLRQVLFSLRQAIQSPGTASPFLLVDRESVTLNPQSDYSIDTSHFRQLVNVSPAQKHNSVTYISRLEQEVSFVRGEFLEAFPPGDSPVFEEWALGRREYYRSQLLDVLHQLAEAALSLGDASCANDYKHWQIEIESWRDSNPRRLQYDG